MSPLDVLRAATFGKRTAEEEREQLREYFVETEQWNRVFGGEIDIVYGAKGSGKSAIYSLVIENQTELFDKGIIAIPAENPQGAPAFQNLSDDPPYDEFEFVSLWKLYLLTLIGQYIRDYGIRNTAADSVTRALEDAELLPKEFTLAKALRYAFDYVKRFTRVASLEGTVDLDQNTGLPTGLSGKIALREPSAGHAKAGVVSIDDLFGTANKALTVAGYTVWVLLDRLDVAFSNNNDLETAALRALFKCYLDIKGHKNISAKIFIRTDIWDKITEQGFREASHIERTITIDWNTDDLVNLVVRRALSNKSVLNFYDLDRDKVLSSFPLQQQFLTEIFPKQVETGPNKPTTFAWMLSRTKDASENAAPREVIHFLNELRTVQVGRYEKGISAPSDTRLFEQAAFKEALPQVSKTRLEQTLYAEFPQTKQSIEALREQKATQTAASLAALWKCTLDEATKRAGDLEGIGFFERIAGASETYWRVPFLYRPALESIQGTADTPAGQQSEPAELAEE
jgi:hypothetical protein